MVDRGPHQPRRTAPWYELLGLIVPLAILVVIIWPWVRANGDRADWQRTNGVAGTEVDRDHRMVTYVLPDGVERTSTVPVMRTVEEGQLIELYYPPGRPDLIEHDRSDFVLPYIVFGAFAAVSTCVIVGRFVVRVRHLRRQVPDPS